MTTDTSEKGLEALIVRDMLAAGWLARARTTIGATASISTTCGPLYSPHNRNWSRYSTSPTTAPHGGNSSLGWRRKLAPEA